MTADVFSISKSGAIERAIEVLDKGGLIAFATDTVYGLAAPAFSKEGIEKLFNAKARDVGRAIAVLIGSLDQLNQVTSGISVQALKLAAKFWPGALTLVVPKHPFLPDNLSPLPTIGIRIPNHDFALALLNRAGPLATTSANLTGQANPLCADDVLAQLGERIDLILDGGRVTGGVPSTVVDCTGVDLKILRQGAISEYEIRLALV
jgi:L-threonylcarbamoyladenylate synthase